MRQGSGNGHPLPTCGPHQLFSCAGVDIYNCQTEKDFSDSRQQLPPRRKVSSWRRWPRRSSRLSWCRWPSVPATQVPTCYARCHCKPSMIHRAPCGHSRPSSLLLAAANAPPCPAHAARTAKQSELMTHAALYHELFISTVCSGQNLLRAGIKNECSRMELSDILGYIEALK